jgi:kynurenine 3-monooxygenase
MSKITIIGAGLVGSLLSIALKKRGHDVSVFEKRSDPRTAKMIEGRSINLILTSRGLKALDGVGLKEQSLKLTVPVFGRLMHAKDRTLQYQPYGRDQSECNYSVSRSDLNNFLIDQAQALGVAFAFSHELKTLNRAEKTLCFQNEERATYDFLLATDGAGSAVRKSLEEQGIDLGSSVDFINADYKELFMPLDSTGKPKLKTEALHIWPRGRHMLMALPNLDGSFTMTVYLPTHTYSPHFGELKTPEDIERYLAQEFPDALELMPNAVEEFLTNPQGRLGTVRLNKWSDGADIALLGDASHAIVPFFGQGMNSGFEDVTTMVELLDQHQEDFRAVFDQLTQDRRVHTNAIADMALENFVEMSELVGVEEFLIKKKMEHAIELAFPDRYRSRYGLICYTLKPYAECLEIGERQKRLLQECFDRFQKPEQLDLDWIEKQLNQLC